MIPALFAPISYNEWLVARYYHGLSNPTPQEMKIVRDSMEAWSRLSLAMAEIEKLKRDAAK